MISILILSFSFLTYPVIVILHLLLWLVGRIDRTGFLEKCGWIRSVPFKTADQCLWVHLSSMGEYNTARHFIKNLHDRYRKPIFLSYYRQDVAVKADHDDFIHCHQCLPLENYLAFQRLIRKVQPAGVLIFETEIWPVFLYALKRNNVPVYLLSAYVYDQHFRFYLRFRVLFRETMRTYRKILAASRRDSDKFLALGADPAVLQVTGNLKYDIQRPEHKDDLALKQKFGFDEDAFVFTAGSVHSREDIMLALLFPELCPHLERFIFVLAPRYLNRVDELCRYLKHQNLPHRCRTETGPSACKLPYIFILDTFGELDEIYAVSDLVFVGGSLVPHGGHNILEPIFYNKKTFSGPHTRNFAEMVERFSDYVDVVEYSQITRYILNQTKFDAARDNGRSLLMSMAGVGDKILSVLDSTIDK